MNIYVFSVPLVCGDFVRAEVIAPHRDAAIDNLRHGNYELLDIHHLLDIEGCELVKAYDFDGEDVSV